MLARLKKVCVQSFEQGQRFLDLGVSQSQLVVTGSIKFDVSLPEDLEQRRSELKVLFSGRTVFLAASTHEGEETMVLEAYRDLKADPSNLLIIAPRHPHRAKRVVDICKAFDMQVVQHSDQQHCDRKTSVYLLDTMGELTYFYSISDIAFVGGSLVDVGGHNPMEPANLGVPMLMGKYRRNIDDIADQFIGAGAMQIVDDAKDLSLKWQALLADKNHRAEMSAWALKVMEQNRGALDRVERIIEELIC